MPLDLDYKTAGAWGPGKGRKLSGAEVDENFYEVEQAIESLETSRPQPNNIVAITTDSTSITFHFQDGSTIGPLPLPILEFRYRGAWQPSTLYAILDVFIVENVGEFSVLTDHTSAGVFDPAAVDVDGNPLYLLMLPMSSGATSLDGLTDVTLTTPTDGQILRYDLASGQWLNRDMPPLDELGDVIITAAVDGQALMFDLASAKWINRKVKVTDLGDVFLSSLADQQILQWHASGSVWVNVNPPSGTGGGSSILHARGDWSTTGIYAPNDVVRDGAGYFACWLGVGSSALRPAADPAHWTQLSTVDSAAFDAAFGNTPGTIAHRSLTGWEAFGAGANGTYLKSQGAGQPLHYDQPALGGLSGVDLSGGVLDKQYLRYDLASTSWKPTGEGYFTATGAPAVVYAIRTDSPHTDTQIGAFVAGGSDGTSINLTPAGGFLVEATENWTAGKRGTRLAFAVIGSGTTTLLRSFAIESDGGLLDPAATGGSLGPGTINLSGGYYVDGAPLSTVGSLANDLDAISSIRGSVLYRGASEWQALGPATAGMVFTTGGPGADPFWGTASGGSGTLGGLTDVDPTGLADGYSLRYDGTTSTWRVYATGLFTSLQLRRESSVNGTTATADNFAGSQSAVTSFPNFAARQARGTITAPAAIQAGDVIGTTTFYGWDGIAYGLGISVQARATENWSGTAHGADLWLSTTANGTTAPVFCLQLTQDGKLIVNGSRIGASYGIAFSAPQATPYAAGQVIGHHPVSVAIQIPANFAIAGTRTSQAMGTAHATSSTVFSVQKCLAASDPSVDANFTEIGTITFAAGTVTPTFATAGGTAQSLASGDRLRVRAPATADATFAGFACNLAALEV